MLECRFYLTEKERLGRSGYAVGLSAISLLASSRSKIPVPKSRPRSQIPLPKDAAPIPNAFLGDEEWGMGTRNGEWGRGMGNGDGEWGRGIL